MMPGDGLTSEAAAKEIRNFLLRHAEECNELLIDLQSQRSREEFRQCAVLMGYVMYALYEKGLAPIFRRYPHLKPEGLN